MPKTKTQEVVFSLLMAFAMTYAMELYNLSLNAHGLHGKLFLEVFHDLFFMMFLVLIMEKLIAGKLARKAAFRMVTPGKDHPFLITLAIQCCTVWLMCPLMSLAAVLLFKQPGTDFLAIWLQTVAFNFPMAFFWQLFFAGPVVRYLLRCLFPEKETTSSKKNDLAQI